MIGKSCDHAGPCKEAHSELTFRRKAIAMPGAILPLLVVLSAFLAVPSAAQTASVKTVFEKHNLLGTFAWDCSKPASKANYYYVHRAVDGGQVQRDLMSGPTTRDWVATLEKAA